MDSILIIDDEPQIRKLLSRMMELEGYEVFQAADCQSTLKQLKLHNPQVVLCDVFLPDGNGVDMVTTIKKLYPELEVILLTAHGNIPEGVQAIKHGAVDYITKGDDNNKIIPLISRAMAQAKKNVGEKVKTEETQSFSFDAIKGKSEGMQQAVALARKVSATDVTVLLTGETGTGKEVFAQAIHRNSLRKENAFVAVNCSAFSKDLLESEIFGHKAGSFTGAMKDKKGLFEVADNGTIFLDEIGEMAYVTMRCNSPLRNCTAKINGIPVKVYHANGIWTVKHKMEQAGEMRVEFCYGNGKRTHADLLVIDNVKDLVNKRISFIRNRQQMNNPRDLRDGAYMVYDCEADSIYPNNTPNCNPVDRDEGAERVGMGVLLAKQYLLSDKKDNDLKSSLLRYAKFLRTRLQTPEYVTYSSVDQKNRNRAYNYVWIAEFYFYMYRATGNRQFVRDGYETLRSMFRQFGHGFYGIGYPVCLGLQCLKEAKMENEHQLLLDDFKTIGDKFIANGVNYPASEVNYEQSIVAPALQLLAQVYLETKERRYLDEVKRQLPVVEAFNGFQPSFHLNEIAIRHWDGHWFGKYELFGDTFPHYWSTVTASVYHYYALCTGDTSYQKLAEEIVRNNLCLFFEDGKASCAYMYPHKVNGEKAHFYDPYANDQDWALVYWLQVMKNL